MEERGREQEEKESEVEKSETQESGIESEMEAWTWAWACDERGLLQFHVRDRDEIRKSGQEVRAQRARYVNSPQWKAAGPLCWRGFLEVLREMGLGT